MSFNSIQEIFQAFNHLKVLVIGDVMIDSYLWGKVNRISPEAPVPIVSVEKTEKRLGGAANVAMNVQALGATPILCSVIGDDEESRDFLNLMETQKLSQEGILLSQERITTIKHRILSGHQHMLRIDSETTKPLSQKDNFLLLEVMFKLIPSVDAIIFEDYDKGVLSETFIQKIIAEANRQHTPTIVDPKKRNFLSYKGATLFKPNLKELKEGLKNDFDVDNENELTEAVAKLKSELKVNQAFVTLSEKGVYMDSDDGRFAIPAHIRKIADVSGAGDTVVSVAGLAAALDLSPKLTAELANLAGGLVCEQIGVVSINKQNLLAEAVKNQLSLI